MLVKCFVCTKLCLTCNNFYKKWLRSPFKIKPLLSLSLSLWLYYVHPQIFEAFEKESLFGYSSTSSCHIYRVKACLRFKQFQVHSWYEMEIWYICLGCIYVPVSTHLIGTISLRSVTQLCYNVFVLPSYVFPSAKQIRRVIISLCMSLSWFRKLQWICILVQGLLSTLSPTSNYNEAWSK